MGGWGGYTIKTNELHLLLENLIQRMMVGKNYKELK